MPCAQVQQPLEREPEALPPHQSPAPCSLGRARQGPEKGKEPEAFAAGRNSSIIAQHKEMAEHRDDSLISGHQPKLTAS